MSGLPPALGALDEQPAGAAVFLDYDGTLAPIVADPDDARPLAGVPAVLADLARRFGLVAVVSGRPVAFLLGVLDHPPGVQLAGLYGMETAGGPGGRPAAGAEAEAWRPVVADATARAVAGAPAGARVEAKGLTVTLHWREVPEAEPWARRFAEAERGRSGLVAQPGRLALELRPPIAIDKGSVVHRLAAGHDPLACFGDDLGDLPAFAALDALAAGGATVVKVAVVDDESPPEVAAAADVVLEGPAAALAVLRRLADGP